MKKGRMNNLYEKIAKKTGLSKHDINGILKVTSYELVEILKEEQRFYWDGLGLFFVNIKDTGLSVRIKLSEETYERLNTKKEKSDEIIFE
jgi:nucleoid DNA-binding protein